MKYGPEKTEEICNLIFLGNNRNDACLLADIGQATFYEWMQKTEFAECIKKAEAKFKGLNIQIIQSAATRSWQAAAWLLERKYRDEYALKIEDHGRTKEEASKQATDAAISLLKILEEAGRNANNNRTGTGSRPSSMENGSSSVQTESPAASGI